MVLIKIYNKEKSLLSSGHDLDKVLKEALMIHSDNEYPDKYMWFEDYLDRLSDIKKRELIESKGWEVKFLSGKDKCPFCGFEFDVYDNIEYDCPKCSFSMQNPNVKTITFSLDETIVTKTESTINCVVKKDTDEKLADNGIIDFLNNYALKIDYSVMDKTVDKVINQIKIMNE